MGVLHQGVCYPDLPAAKQEVCSQGNQFWQSGTTLYSSECTSTAFTGSSYVLCRRTNGGACTNVTMQYPSMTPCDYSGGSDLALDWGYLAMALLVVIWGGKQIIRLFSVHHTPES